LPDLAEILDNPSYKNEPLVRRAINAALRVGGDEQGDRLIEYTKSDEAPGILRAEALATLAHWGTPSVLDRVDGRFRGLAKRDSGYVAGKIVPVLEDLLSENQDILITSAAEAAGHLGITALADKERVLLKDHPNPAVRAAMINSLSEMNYDRMNEVMITGSGDRSPEVRAAALALIDQIDLDPASFNALVRPVFQLGSVKEQQEVLKVMGTMPSETTVPILEDLLGGWKNDQLSDGITLELFEAVEGTNNSALLAQIEPYQQSGNTTEDYMDALYGGDRGIGARLFRNHPAAQCLRCHSWEEDPNSVGPSLRNIADKLDRQQLLEALIEPSARLAPGYGSVSLTLKDGSQANGILLEENVSEIFLRTNQAEPLKIEKARIAERRNNPSSMPPMGGILSKREIRDLVKYLSTLKSD